MSQCFTGNNEALRLIKQQLTYTLDKISAYLLLDANLFVLGNKMCQVCSTCTQSFTRAGDNSNAVEISVMPVLHEDDEGS